jgi:O-antigen ligase
MNIAVIYTLLCVAVLPFWIAQQHLGGRSIPFILATCGYVLYSLASGINIPMDNTTMIAGSIAVWLLMSLTWTDTKRSVFELFNLLAYLVLFTVARTIPLVITVSAVFTIGVSFATMEAVRIVKRRKFPNAGETFTFGNGNHTGAFMIVSLFTGIWLVINLSVWFTPFVLLIAAVLIISRCKGAIAGCVSAGAVTLFITEFWQPAALISLVAAAFVLRRFNAIPNARASIGGRIWLYLASLEMIVKKPFTGYGLNSYQKELPDIIARITKSKLHEIAGDRLKAQMNTRSHRVHNDHLEIMSEIGIPGYLLFVYLFLSVTYDPIILGLLIAFLIHALFFFPFREVHTAVPFWVIMGSMAGGSISAVTMPLLIKILIGCIVAAVIIQTLHRFLGQWYSEMAKNKPGITEEQKLEYIDIAVSHDPYDTGYLSDAAYYYSKANPVKSFFYAARCLLHYDGTRMKQGVYDLFARTLIAAKEVNVCHFVEDKALWIDPIFQPAITIKSYLYSRYAGGKK